VNAVGAGTASSGMSGTPTAVTITWSTKTNLLQDGSDLLNTGLLRAAINFSPDAVGAYTLHGIPFTIQSSATGSGSYWQVLNTGSGTGIDSNRLGGQSYYPTDPSAFPLGYLINDYKFMFTDAGETHDFVMQNLNVGSSYRLQVVFERNGAASGRLITGGNSSPSVSYGGNSLGAAMITAEWTATAATQTFRQPIQAGCVAGFVLTDLSIYPPLAPTITGITAGDGTLSAAFTAPSSDGGAAITNYKYSTDGGSTFTAVSPASTTSPLAISGLTNGTTYQVKILAVNSAGDGTPSTAVAGTPGTPYQLWLNGAPATDANLREFAFGTAETGPLVLDSGGKISTRGQAPIIQTTVDSALVTLTYARRKNSGCAYSAQFSNNLGTWLASDDASLIYPPAVPTEVVVDNGDDMEVVSVKFPIFRKNDDGSYGKMEQNFCRIAVTTN